jgi:hypothetical protein
MFVADLVRVALTHPYEIPDSLYILKLVKSNTTMLLFHTFLCSHLQ